MEINDGEEGDDILVAYSPKTRTTYYKFKKRDLRLYDYGLMVLASSILFLVSSWLPVETIRGFVLVFLSSMAVFWFVLSMTILCNKEYEMRQKIMRYFKLALLIHAASIAFIHPVLTNVVVVVCGVVIFGALGWAGLIDQLSKESK